MEHIDDVRWRKSTHSSGNGGDCVEAASRDSHVLVRDTKEYGKGQVHRFSAGEWRAFVAQLKSDR